MLAELPRFLSISPPDPGGVSMWVAAGPGLVEVEGVGLLLRLTVERESAVRSWVEDLSEHGVAVILHARTPGGARLAVELGLGLHLPSRVDPRPWRARIRGLLGASCHDRGELERASGFCDYATLSPIYAPRSKPEDARPTIGLAGLAEACRGLELPVLALGGIAPGRVAPCLEAGAWGVAGIGSFGEHHSLEAMAAEIALAGAVRHPRR